MGHNPPRRLRAGWRVPMTANAADTNGLACFSKLERVRDDTFLVRHPMTDQRCLTMTQPNNYVLEGGASKQVLHGEAH
jgi:hypothetical protein